VRVLSQVRRMSIRRFLPKKTLEFKYKMVRYRCKLSPSGILGKHNSDIMTTDIAATDSDDTVVLISRMNEETTSMQLVTCFQ